MIVLPIELSVSLDSPRETKDLYKRALNALLDAMSDVMGYEANAEEIVIRVEKEEGNCRVFGIYSASNEIIGYIEVREDRSSMRAEVKVTLSV